MRREVKKDLGGILGEGKKVLVVHESIDFTPKHKIPKLKITRETSYIHSPHGYLHILREYKLSQKLYAASHVVPRFLRFGFLNDFLFLKFRKHVF